MGLMADSRTGCVEQLEALRTANPTKLGEVYPVAPASYALGLPAAYVGEFRGNLYQTGRLRQFTGSEQDIVFVFPTPDNEEQQEAADELVDLLLAAWPVDGRYISSRTNVVGEPVRIRSATELDSGGISYPAVVVTVGRITHLEGR
jgi:hypothetical protein